MTLRICSSPGLGGRALALRQGEDGWPRGEGWMVPHLRGCESLRAGNYSVGRRGMSPSAPEELPSTRWICLAGPEWLWKGHTGTEPWRNPAGDPGAPRLLRLGFLPGNTPG